MKKSEVYHTEGLGRARRLHGLFDDLGTASPITAALGLAERDEKEAERGSRQGSGKWPNVGDLFATSTFNPHGEMDEGEEPRGKDDFGDALPRGGRRPQKVAAPMIASEGTGSSGANQSSLGAPSRDATSSRSSCGIDYFYRKWCRAASPD